ncbi:MAG: hypothetical protein J6T69_07870 [Methanobrevibacter sp.]|nr:hypothetical protein [Methanobrevibacter sp.]
MKEQFKGQKEDGTLMSGVLLLESNSKKEREAVLKEYKFLSGAVKLIRVYDGMNECYEEVNI